MALKLYKPITPGMRGRVDLLRDEITAQKPEKSLTTGKKSNAGRDSDLLYAYFLEIDRESKEKIFNSYWENKKLNGYRRNRKNGKS